MKIKDSLLLDNFELVFQKKLIFYGAGKVGQEALEWIENIKEIYSRLECFCETDTTKWNGSQSDDIAYLGIPVYSLEQISKKFTSDEILFVLTTKRGGAHKEMLENLSYGFPSMMYCVTWFGLWFSITWNLWHKQISVESRRLWSMREQIAKTLYIGQDNHDFNLLDDNPIVVYSSTKTASSSIVTSLYKNGLEGSHVHRILDKNERPRVIRDNYRENFILNKNKKQNIKVITLMRDPIARAISWYFEFIYPGFIRHEINRGGNIFNDIMELIRRTGVKESRNNLLYWFDIEIKRVFDIDIYQYDFDREKGYAVIKEGNTEILLLTLENLNQNEEIIGDFLGVKNFKLFNSNLGEQKEYSYLYEEIRQELKVDASIVELHFICNERIKHFYTDEQIKIFIDKYKK